MSRIRLKDVDGVPHFHVTIRESYTIYLGSTADSDELQAALDATPNTCVRSVAREHLPCPMDFGDWRIEHLLPVTEANFVALRGTTFQWNVNDRKLCDRIFAHELSADGLIAQLPDTISKVNDPSQAPTPKTSYMRTAALSITAFAIDFVGYCVVGIFAVATMFLPFGLLFSILTRDWTCLYMLPVLGGIVGCLVGGGQTFVVWFSDPKYVGKERQPLFSATIDTFFLAFAPCWVRMVYFAYMVAAKDYSQARPGRLIRSAIGAFAGGLFGAYLYWMLSHAVPHADPTIEVPLILILFPATFAAVAGALTDSR